MDRRIKVVRDIRKVDLRHLGSKRRQRPTAIWARADGAFKGQHKLKSTVVIFGAAEDRGAPQRVGVGKDFSVRK